jgi:alpha-glucosidase (family GH31 glycosyl hydrolase)
MDFWWTDWQQGGTEGGCAGGKQNPTIWTDKQRATEHLRRGENVRGINLARFGGLGSHRYQVGFSGDVATLSWANLAFQPYFSYVTCPLLCTFLAAIADAVTAASTNTAA